MQKDDSGCPVYDMEFTAITVGEVIADGNIKTKNRRENMKMKQFVEKMKRSEMIAGIVFVILGLVLLIWPGISIQIACRGIGVLLLVYGMIQIIAYLRNKDKNLAAYSMFTVGIVTGVLGAWIALRPETVIVALPIITGIILVLHGAQNILQAVRLKKQMYSKWWIAVVIGLITAIFGIILICNPFTAVDVLIRIIGVFLICDGGSDIWIQFRITEKGEI